MGRELTDSTGASVIIEVIGDGPARSYTVRLAGDAEPAGRADFIADEDERERIFFHTEVDSAFGGRGLSGLLVQAALSDALDEGFVVVPVCRLFAAHLRKHGDAYLAEGGRFRPARPADVALVGHSVRGATATRPDA